MQFLENYIKKHISIITDVFKYDKADDGYKNKIYIAGIVLFYISILMLSSIVLYPIFSFLYSITSFSIMSILFLLGNLIMVILYDDVKKNIDKVKNYKTNKKDDDSDIDDVFDPDEYDEPF